MTDRFPYRHLIWDWNGTLLDDAYLCVDVMNELMTSRGLGTMDATRYQTVFDFPVRDYYAGLGFDFSAEPFETVSTEFITRYEARKMECPLRPGVRETLQAFAEAGVPQSLLSAAKQDYLDHILERHDLHGFFETVRGADDHHAHGKADKGRRLMADLALPEGAALMVGDTRHDAAVAEAMGADCWLLPGGHQSRARLAACGVPVVEDLAAVRERAGG